MLEQRAVGSSENPSENPTWPGEVAILDWIDSWQAVHDDLNQLLMAYAQADSGHDTSSFQPLIEQINSSMRLLRHRVCWLRNYLTHTGDLPYDPQS